MELSAFIQTVNYTLAVIFFLCYSYQLFYVPLSHLKKDRPHAPDVYKRQVFWSYRSPSCQQ